MPQPERWHSPAGRREFIPAQGLPGQPSRLILCPPGHIAPQMELQDLFPFPGLPCEEALERGRDAAGWRQELAALPCFAERV